jgi:hypothetical protein
VVRLRFMRWWYGTREHAFLSHENVTADAAEQLNALCVRYLGFLVEVANLRHNVSSVAHDARELPHQLVVLLKEVVALVSQAVCVCVCVCVVCSDSRYVCAYARPHVCSGEHIDGRVAVQMDMGTVLRALTACILPLDHRPAHAGTS